MCAGDVHHWLGDPETGDLRTPLTELRATAAQVLDEFETVTTLTRQAAEAFAEAAQQVGRLVRRIRGEAPATAEEWISRITELRRAQGHLVTLKDMPYADAAGIDTLAGDVEADIASAAQRAVAFLQREDAFTAHHAEAERLATEAGARRAERLAASAGRVLEAIARRAATLADLDEVNTYFASDPMVAKVRRTGAELRELGDETRAEELEGRLGAARQEAGRALRYRTDLFSDGGATIRLGRHRFAVNRQPPEVTLVPHEDTIALALTGTDYRVPVTDPAFAETRPFWDRTLPSESPDVYRSEYLAARLLAEHGPGSLAGEDLSALARRAAEAAYDEGYERGVHDHDTAAILEAVLRLHERIGLLRYPAPARATAQLFWAHAATADAREQWTRRADALTRARDLFGAESALDGLRNELAKEIGNQTAASYLIEELTTAPAGFAVSDAARTLLDKFRRAVGTFAYDDASPRSRDRARGASSSRHGSPPTRRRPENGSTKAYWPRPSRSNSARTSTATTSPPPPRRRSPDSWAATPAWRDARWSCASTSS